MAELFSGKMLWRFFGPHNRQLDELGTSAGHRFLIEHHILSSIRELQHTSNILSVIFEWKSWCQSFKNKFLFCSMLVTKFVRVMRMLKNQTKLIANRYFIKVKGRKRQFLWSDIFRYLINWINVAGVPPYKYGKVGSIFFSENFLEDSFQR